MTAKSSGNPAAKASAKQPAGAFAEDHAAIARFVDAHHAAQVRYLAEIVKVPSDTPPGDNGRASSRACELLQGLGFEVEQHPVDAKFLADYGMVSVTNLIVRHRFGPGGRTIALNAHGDVVPPGDGWTRPPYGAVVEDGQMYGRGVAVSKSDFATFTYALLALKTLGLTTGAVELHFTYDEEFGGLAGPGWLLERELTKPDLAIAAGFSYGIVTAHNGCLQLEITVHGRAGHGAMPESGRDAMRAANVLLNKLYAYAHGLASTRSSVAGITSPTLNVGLITGGINTNVVPDKVSLKIDRRMIPEEDPTAVEITLRQVIESAMVGLDGIRVEIRRLLLSQALKPLPGHERLVAALSGHAERVFGEPVEATGVPLYTDARLYGQAGIPIVLYGAGPRTILESNAKRSDENLALDDLRRATIVVASAVRDLIES